MDFEMDLQKEIQKPKDFGLVKPMEKLKDLQMAIRKQKGSEKD